MTTTSTANSFTDLARQLTEGRLARNWTQAQLADAASMPRSVIARLESGTASASLPTLQRLADALGESLVITPAKSHPAYRISHTDWKRMKMVTRLKIERQNANLPEPTLAELAEHFGVPETWFHEFYPETFPAPAEVESQKPS